MNKVFKVFNEKTKTFVQSKSTGKDSWKNKASALGVLRSLDCSSDYKILEYIERDGKLHRTQESIISKVEVLDTNYIKTDAELITALEDIKYRMILGDPIKTAYVISNIGNLVNGLKNYKEYFSVK